MGLSLSQIINKFVPTKRVDDDLRENPFNTAVGQEVVSISENFWSRLAREGRWRGNNWSKQAFSSTTTWNWAWYHNADAGFRFYPKRIVMSADVDCELGFNIQAGVQSIGTSYMQMSAFVKAGTPWVIDLDGEWYFEGYTPSGQAGVQINFGVNNAATAGNLFASVVGVEVIANA